MPPRGELVRAVADRLLAERLEVLVRAGGQRQERHVAHLVVERGVGGGERDLERPVVDDLQAFELRVLVAVLVLQLVVALDRREDRGTHLAVGGVRGERPRLRVRLGGDLLAVGEFEAVAQLDRVLGGVVVRRDRLGVRVDQLAGAAERDETFEQLRHDLPAGEVVRVGRDEPARRFDVVDDDLLAVGNTRIDTARRAARRAAAGQRERESERRGDRGGDAFRESCAHDGPLLPLLPLAFRHISNRDVR